MIYEAQCPKCSHWQDYIRKAADCYDTPDCAVCGTKTEKRIRTLSFLSKENLEEHKTFHSYKDGKTYHGRTAYFKHMKEHGLVPAEDLKGEAEYQKAEREKAYDAKLEKDILETMQEKRQGA